MIDHLGVSVRSFAVSRRFYEQAFQPLGYRLVKEFGVAGLFADARNQGYVWVGESKTVFPIHFAILAPDRATVAAFYKAALAAGGKDNGAPGLRAQYHPTYFGAFVLDPDGHNVEAVCHSAE